MLEAPASSSKQGFIMYNSATAANETELTLKNATGEVLLSEVIPYSFSTVIISTPDLKIGDTCTLMIGDTQTEITIDNSSAFNNSGMGGMFGGGKEQGGFFGGMPNGNGKDQDPESFGYGSGSGDVFPEYSPQGGSPEISDDKQNMPELNGGKFGGGKMPGGGMGMPNGEAPGGEIPGGNIPNGEIPDGAPQDGFNLGDLQGNKPPSDLNNGAFGDFQGDPNNGVLPEMPDGDKQEQPSDEAQRPDRGDRQEGMDGNRGDDDRKMQWGQNDRDQIETSNKPANISPNTLILIAVSALLLLAGIIIALKVKH